MRVVPSFDPVEDRVGELVAGVPVVFVEEFELPRVEKALGDGVVRVADRAHRAGRARAV